MRYVYKRFPVYTISASVIVFMVAHVVHTDEPKSNASAEDKTVAVLNEMLATLQQESVKTDEAKGTVPLQQNAPLSTQINSVPTTQVPEQPGVGNSSLPVHSEAVAPLPLQNVHQLPAMQTESVSPVTEAKQMPVEPVAEGKEIGSLEEEKIDEKVGIDTVNLPDPQGNWLYKSIWYERAQERYEDVRRLVDLVWESRGKFLEQRTTLDRTVLDPFYLSVGLRVGELQEVLSDLVGKFKAERAKDGDLDIQERTLSKEVEEGLASIETLHDRVKVVVELDHRIDDALNKLMDQINKVRAYERDAWNNFKKISQLLSDTKARELYYAMDIQMRNIKDIQKYLQNDFASYFQVTLSRVTQEINAIQQAVERLKEQGVDFKTQADVLFQTITSPLKKEVLKEQNDEESARKEEDVDDVAKKVTIFGRILKLFSGAVEIIVYPVKVLFGKLFGGK